nr:methyltransferase [Evansella caseinilytica]
MTDHYYSEKPDVESRRESIAETVAGVAFRFYVDRGVFSKTGMDFGTRLLIESFNPPEAAGAIGDVGCGWGAIGIAVGKKYPARRIVMTDINERAVELAKLNAQLNGVGNAEVLQTNLLEGVTDSFAAVMTNPPIRAGKKVIFALYEQAVGSLLPNGEIWVVIQKKQGAPSTIKKLEELGLEVSVVNKAKGYLIISGKKS